MNPTNFPKEKYTWGICKDILEHIPYDGIEKQLKIIHQHCDNIFVIVPLGDGEKYYIDSYEYDKSHYIREELEWWHSKVHNQDTLMSNLHMILDHLKRIGIFDKNGNGMIIGSV